MPLPRIFFGISMALDYKTLDIQSHRLRFKNLDPKNHTPKTPPQEVWGMDV